MNKACYRELQPYKYQLVDPFAIDTGITEYKEVDTPYLEMQGSDGALTIKTGYAWDGPSGPTIDTLNFMRGSLVHDALYQLIRMEVIKPSYKGHADRLLQRICREDGMSRFRAWYVFQAVKWFGGQAAKPGTEKPLKKICVPVDG